MERRVAPSAGMAFGIALALVWIASAVAALLAPDMITGSAHEHLPLVGLTVWIWTVVSSVYLVMVRSALVGASASRRTGFVAGVAVVWLLMALTCWLAPQFVTGTDPTSIPLAGVLAPILAMVVSGGLCIDLAVAGVQIPTAGSSAPRLLADVPTVRAQDVADTGQ